MGRREPELAEDPAGMADGLFERKTFEPFG